MPECRDKVTAEHGEDHVPGFMKHQVDRMHEGLADGIGLEIKRNEIQTPYAEAGKQSQAGIKGQ
ncbi:MAG: hypothetical protein U5P41_12115 [Gammaproteobacteria bacterium]|nr:hypothetical protein [Gammaproteobacteria bacterium]